MLLPQGLVKIVKFSSYQLKKLRLPSITHHCMDDYKALKISQPGPAITLHNQLESMSYESNWGVYSDWKNMLDCMATGAEDS